MKTQQEINKLAEQEYPIQLNENHHKPDIYDDLNEEQRIAFKNGYTQCQKDMSKISEWQLCPKCFGEGEVSNIGTSSSIYRICPVCNGNKTLIKPII